MSEYLLKCECGTDLVVSNRDAGQNLVCDDCGTEVVAPTLREIKNLPIHEPVDGSDADGNLYFTNVPAASSDWSAQTGYLFSGLTILTLIAFVIGGIKSYHAYEHSLVEDVSQQGMIDGDKMIAGMGALQLYEAWNTVKELKLMAPESSDYQRAQAKLRDAMNIAIVCYIVGGICVIGLAVIMMRRKPNSRPTAE